MRVDDAADAGKAPVDFQVSCEVRRRAKLTLHDFTVHLGDHHVLRRKTAILHSAGLDGDQTIPSRNAGGVSESVEHQAAAHQLEIGLENFFPQSSQKHSDSSI